MAVQSVIVDDSNVVQPVSGTITLIDTTKSTYSASIRGVVTAATATDVLVIQGSSTKIIKIRFIGISGTQTGNAVTPIIILKRSTLDTGGTSTTLINVAHDSNDTAATAIIKSYTANPTLGTLVGNVLQEQITFNNGLASGLEDKIEYEFGVFTKALTLRNANESIAINFNSTTVTAGSINFTIQWTEE